MRFLRKVWGYYRESGWLPLVVVLVMLRLPMWVMFTLMTVANGSRGQYDTAGSFLILGAFLMVALSLITMFMAGSYQAQQGWRGKGWFNRGVSALLFVAIFGLACIVFFGGVGVN